MTERAASTGNQAVANSVVSWPATWQAVGVSWPLCWDRIDAPLAGTLRPEHVRWGVPRGPFRLRQRRVRTRVFGEVAFVAELVPDHVCPATPHVLAWLAWRSMVAAAAAEGLDTAPLQIYSAYRPVSLQREIWAFRLEERRAKRAAAGEPPLAHRALKKQQQKWTAKPGQSAHHTGLALDLVLYHLGRSAGMKSPAYRWLASHAASFGFYPYIPEPWHWEFNPEGLVGAIAQLRQGLGDRQVLGFGGPFLHR